MLLACLLQGRRLNIMNPQSMQDAGGHEKLRRAFRRTTNPHEVISLGEKLGMEFSLEKAKEVAQRHQILLSMHQYDTQNLKGIQ